MYQRILVGTDGSDTAAQAVDAAARLAWTHGAELVIGHAYPLRSTPAEQRAWSTAPAEIRHRCSSGSVAESTIHDAVRRAQAVAGPLVKVSGRYEPGRPVPVLIALVDELDPDVVVIGNRDMPGLFRSGRSVGRAVSRRAGCDVVIVDTLGLRERRRATRERSPAAA
ncbi:MAG: universal stress protein [Mycobacteriales bacterium]